MSGGAVSQACQKLLPQILKIGAHLLQVDTSAVSIQNGSVHGSGKSVSLAEIANAWYLSPQLLPKDVDPVGLEATVGYKPRVDTGAFSYATHVALVAVDPQMGGIEILDYVVVEDCGVLVNPMVVEGQTIGGVAQGIGTALYEEMRYDDLAQPLASTLADYVMPGATEVPNIRMDHFETPSPHTEFGAKGMGEGGAIAPPAAIFGAVNDALRRVGATELARTPLTPRRVLEALAQTKVQPS
jgi:carbon-monoxide dehydrogenase large subunit